MYQRLPIALAALAIALAATGCSHAEYPRRPPALLTLVAASDAHAVQGEPLVARIAPGLLMEDVAHQMFTRAWQLGFRYLSSLETHAQVDYQGHVYDCAVTVGSRAEVAAWEKSHAGSPAVEGELTRRVVVGAQSGIVCVNDTRPSRGGLTPSLRTDGYFVGDFAPRTCQSTAKRGGHDMYRFQQITALGDPVWAWIGLAWPSGFAESKPRCTLRTDAHVGDTPVHTLTAIVYKR